MRVILCCAGGFSTTMLMERMKKTIEESAKLKSEDFSFKAIPVDLLPAEVEHCDAIVVGPQIAHKMEQIEKIAAPYPVVCVLVSQETYGKMDGATVLKQVLVARKKAERAQ